MNLKSYPDSEMLAIDLANTLADELTEALHNEDRVLFAVPGGTSPGPVFDDLCAADIEWDRVDVVLTDERWVPEDHPRSNARLIKERLLVHRASAARFIPLFTPAHAPEDVLADLESMIVPELPIAVALMGMGADMHTASLFPNAPGLSKALASDAPILVPVYPEDQPEARVTLSARILDRAISKHLLITGDAKREALQEALHMEPEDAPVAAVLNGATVHWAPS
ncbi:6-phosphogluconolactonase [uncultured Shimia sp.]|uniref:6-phosphogluconolactonase n=1 Tax=uncultured Shimia sp. TaxID=573152 RepID=UPI0026273754|nr:6-phosphogluconolactonase [uncultured Shimia sp.]